MSPSTRTWTLVDSLVAGECLTYREGSSMTATIIRAAKRLVRKRTKMAMI